MLKPFFQKLFCIHKCNTKYLNNLKDGLYDEDMGVLYESGSRKGLVNWQFQTQRHSDGYWQWGGKKGKMQTKEIVLKILISNSAFKNAFEYFGE